MAGVALANPKQQFSDSTGTPLAGGFVYVYEAGTTTEANTWEDRALTTLNTNPVVLDASGFGTFWLDPDETYKLVVKNSAGVTQYTVDNVVGAAGVQVLDEVQAAADAYIEEMEEILADTETARDSALAATKIYATTVAGLAAVANGEYFYVPSTDDAESLILYNDNAGVAEEVKRMPSAELLEGFSAEPDVEATDAWFIADELGRKAIRVKSTGEFVTTQQGATVLNRRGGGRFTHQINFINNTGQSNGEGASSNVAVTTAQEYDNVGFAEGVSSPEQFLALTVALTAPGGGGRGESPMYGACGYVKELLLEENSLAYGDNDYQLCAANNAISGYTLAQLSSGTVPYVRAVAQATAGATLAAGLGKTFAWQASLMTHGEADAGADNTVTATDPPTTSGATYKAGLKTLATDFAASSKTATGQTHDPIIIANQVAIRSREIAIAQLDASNESGLVYLACPSYQFDYEADGTHFTETSIKWLGGYYAEVYKRVVIEGEDWKPLQPVAHSVIGGTIDLIFNKTGLALDTTLVPSQTNSGFSVINGASVSQSIASVAVVAPNRVRITLSSGSFATGWTVRYGYNAATGKGGFTGGCGNLRDTRGDTKTYGAITKTMHNWCVIFNYGL